MTNIIVRYLPIHAILISIPHSILWGIASVPKVYKTYERKLTTLFHIKINCHLW